MWVESSGVMNVHECVWLCVYETRYSFQDDNIFGRCLDHPSSKKPKDKLPLTNLTLLPHTAFFLSVPNYLIVPSRAWLWHQFLANFQLAMDTSSLLPTCSFVLHCTKTIECTLNGYQVLPQSAALSLLSFTVKTVREEPCRNKCTVSCHSLCLSTSLPTQT